ncbi:uncharacterized protein LOC115753371 isoform X2 [Rhodamnia argentea]|uniref:Uncharacterized protein LOC115753371 isoform X2 n=1 Tax=Rhodamnia argentea TaxID=178133 RepID=A0A8B8QKY1_9MYRT|nr:uncharacterized protein LOC115753371 isoform X2 [Rhodamnia argentea]
MSEKEARTIKLRCPPLSRTVTIAARDEQRLDLGSIARAFGLDPQTLKLNGHFVSRGADLVSPSVTWRSLLSFFSSKGLPTGGDGGDALLVDGKLLRIGSKRGHDPEGMMGRPKHDEDCSGQSRRQSEEVHISKPTKKSKIDDSDCRCRCFSMTDNGLGSKRKHLSEEVSLLKRLKINDASSDFGSFVCRYMGENLKRLRDDGRGVTYASSKRVR